jgi:hypothetical protein
LREPGAGAGGRRAYVEVGVEDEDSCRERRRTAAGGARGRAPARHGGERRHERVEQLTVLISERRVVGGSHQVQAAPEAVPVAQRDA